MREYLITHKTVAVLITALTIFYFLPQDLLITLVSFITFYFAFWFYKLGFKPVLLGIVSLFWGFCIYKEVLDKVCLTLLVLLLIAIAVCNLDFTQQLKFNKTHKRNLQ